MAPPLQALHRTNKGVFTQYNSVHEIPEGAVRVARNVTVQKEGTLTPRIGLRRYGAQFQPSRLFEFDDRLVGLEGTELRYDSDGLGTWVAWDGVWQAPDSSSKIRSIQARTALFLQTSRGIFFTEDLDTTPIRAGLATGLDIKLSLSGAGLLGYLQPGEQVGYRAVWGRLTPYGSLQLGAPSMREVIANPWTEISWTYAAGTVTVAHSNHGYSNGDTIMTEDFSDAAALPTGTITVTGASAYTYSPVGTPAASGTGKIAKLRSVQCVLTAPIDLQPGDFWEVYRTVSTAIGTDPGDECFRVIRSIAQPNLAVAKAGVTLSRSGTTVTVSITAHGLSTGDVVWILSPSDAGFEAGPHPITYGTVDTFTYSTTGSGALNGTGSVRYRTVTHLDGLDESFLSDKLYTNPSQEEITQANTRPPWSKTMCLWKNRMWYGNTKKEHYIDLQLSEMTGITPDTSSLTLTLGVATETYTFSTAENLQTKKFATDATSVTTAEKIRNTMKALCRVINLSSDLFYAWYTSGIQDAPGQITIEARELNTAEFSVTVNSAATGAAFEPDIPTTGTDLRSDDFRLLNGVYNSKVDQPHAVPDANFDEDLGDPSKEILAMVPTRDSIIVVKEDGIFRISGDSERTFTFKPLDLTVHGKAPESWVPLDNAIWGLSTKGVVRVTESGTLVMSKPIEDQVLYLLEHANIDSVCYGVGHETARKYLLACPEFHSESGCTMFWVFDSSGQIGPTSWHRPTRCGHLKFRDRKLYVSSADNDDHVFVERRDFSDTDYMDEELECSLDSVDTFEDAVLGTMTRVLVTFPIAGTLNTSMVPKAGDLFRKTPSSLPYSRIRRVDSVSADTYYLYLSHLFPGLTAGTGTITRSIPTLVEWHGEAADVASLLKSFACVQFYFQNDQMIVPKVGFRSDLNDAWEEYEIDYSLQTDNSVRVHVPLQQSLGRRLELRLTDNCAKNPWELLEVAVEFFKTSLDTTMLPR